MQGRSTDTFREGARSVVQQGWMAGIKEEREGQRDRGEGRQARNNPYQSAPKPSSASKVSGGNMILLRGLDSLRFHELVKIERISFSATFLQLR
ncbi:hypothetical protein E2C01_067366 [Portunus trituberculatus]|uniref:Uncharacterized protein n=1 Tax=Portunus trituberculatus TaxID=210409 RepID=A0A5B7HTE9_PORTR|nr:hypothetical protein [Portunus trituberculatus]